MRSRPVDALLHLQVLARDGGLVRRLLALMRAVGARLERGGQHAVAVARSQQRHHRPVRRLAQLMHHLVQLVQRAAGVEDHRHVLRHAPQRHAVLVTQHRGQQRQRLARAGGRLQQTVAPFHPRLRRRAHESQLRRRGRKREVHSQAAAQILRQAKLAIRAQAQAGDGALHAPHARHGVDKRPALLPPVQRRRCGRRLGLHSCSSLGFHRSCPLGLHSCCSLGLAAGHGARGRGVSGFVVGQLDGRVSAASSRG